MSSRNPGAECRCVSADDGDLPTVSYRNQAPVVETLENTEPTGGPDMTWKSKFRIPLTISTRVSLIVMVPSLFW